MKKIVSIAFLSILLLIFFQNCRRIGGCDAGMPMFYIHYVDTTGSALFADGQNGYIKDSTYFIDANGNIICNAASYFVDWASSTMKIGPYENANDKYSVIVVHLKNRVEDTVKRHLGILEYCPTLDSIWYNGKLSRLNDSCACIMVVH